MKKNVGILTIILVAIFIIVIYLFLCFGAYLYPVKYIEIIEKYSIEYAVDKSLIASVINIESKFNKNAVSNKGAKGLMQITDKTAIWLCELIGEEYSQEKMFDADFNIKLGTFYLSYLLNKFENLDTALASYNAGEGPVRFWLTSSDYSKDGVTIFNIPYEESQSCIIDFCFFWYSSLVIWKCRSF